MKEIVSDCSYYPRSFLEGRFALEPLINFKVQFPIDNDLRFWWIFV